MRNLDLDYAVIARPYPFWMRLVLLLLAIASIVMLVSYYQSLTAEMNTYQAGITDSQFQEPVAGNDPVVNEAMSHAIKTQHDLSYPWLSLFSSLEAVKQSHKHIDLLNVIPNKAKSELRLEGEAKSFDQITHFLNDLKTDKAFEDAVLINQYLVEPDSLRENNGQPLYTFNLLLKWRIK